MVDWVICFGWSSLELGVFWGRLCTLVVCGEGGMVDYSLKKD